MQPVGGGGTGDLRLGELLTSFSLAIDLGLGQPLEHVARSCLTAQLLGERVGVDQTDRDAAYYVSLLAWVGCTSDSYEVAQLFGDDRSWRADSYEAELTGLGALAFMVRHAGSDGGLLKRLRAVATVLSTGGKPVMQNILAHCQVTARLAEQLGFGVEVCEPLMHNFARWDGKGFPPESTGTGIPLPMRLVHITDQFEFLRRTRGVEAAVPAIRAQRGKAFDPELVDELAASAGEIAAQLDADTTVDAVVEREPAPARSLRAGELDAALAALGDFVDLKSPYFAGHSRGVAELARGATERLCLPAEQAALARRAACVHDVGRAAVPNVIWDKPGPLSRAQMERVRLHAYYADRVLSGPGLGELRAVAAAHHERLDGSGYPKGLSGPQLAPAARVLAAADAYQAMLEPRPHRPALAPDDAAAELRADVKAGRLDADAAEAVLDAAGHRTGRRRRVAGPAGLTAREVEVLGLLARGRSNKAIAAALHIAPKTAANHVEHIYTKIGVSTRPAATLFAVQHGLLDVGAAEDGENTP